MAFQIQQRSDTAANWTTLNPTLAQGEIGFETDTNKFKFGDGITAWASLPYAGGSGGSGITTLTGDVTATGSGSVAATVAAVGGSTAANVHTSQLLTAAATAANTPNELVKRDGSGNFSANVITAALVGNASTATSATTAGSATTAATATNFSGALAGDVTGNQGSTVVAQVGGKTAAAVAAAVDQMNPSIVSGWIDDFDSQNVQGTTNWGSISANGGGAGLQGALSAGHPGLIKCFTNGATSYAYIYKDVNWLFGGGQVTLDCVGKIDVLSNGAGTSFNTVFGFSDVFDGTLPSGGNGIWFQAIDSENSGMWTVNTAAGGLRTQVNTSIMPVANTFTHLRIVVNAAGTSVSFYIDGVLAGTITTHIPTLKVGMVSGVTTASGTGNRFWYTDLVQLQIALTTPRY